MAFIRLVIFGFIGMTVVYFSISLYSRSIRKERLENAFDADHADGGAPGARQAFVEEGMIAYNNSIRPRLIGLIYVVPTIVIGTIIYIINAN